MRLSRRSFTAGAALAGAGVVVGRWVGPVRAAATREVIAHDAVMEPRRSGPWTGHQIARMTVHHDAVELHDNRLAPSRIRAAQGAHLRSGWPDIAYHYLIDRLGNVYEGRPPGFRGDTYTTYDPTGHLLVTALGNFEAQEVTAAQWSALVDVLAAGSASYGVPPSTITGHRAWAATSCPGRNLQARIASGELRTAVDQRKAAGGVALQVLPLEDSHQRVAMIEAGVAGMNDDVPAPAIVRDEEGQRWVFVRGTDGALWARRANAAWFSLGGVLTSGPAAAVGPGGGISVVARGANGSTWLIRLSPTGEWGAWEDLGGRS